VQAKLKPEYVAPFVGYLAHDSCEPNGGLFEIGAGWIAKLRWQRTRGAMFDLREAMTPEGIAARYADVENWDEATNPSSPNDAFGPIMENLSKL
jgi:3-hydroxyacyl-CoA dehydrogenase/3a,7a,12a-trihydroxy-5b-cholest-24-enoyl-CoA hydratase